MRSALVFAVFLLTMAASKADTALDERVLRLTETLRCLVCQNQTVAESNSELANDLRGQVRTQLAAGKNEQQVRDFMVQRYGDFVLYRPPLKLSTWLLWFSPFALLLLACAGLFLTLRRQKAVDVGDVTPEEMARAEALLHNSAKEGK